MTLRLRKIIMWTFFAAFAIAGPVMVLYTTGYSFNLQKRKIEAVGVLMLDAKPADSQLFINDQPQKGGAPWRFNGLRPNYYQIKIAKDGHYSWQKNLEIKPKTSTLAYNIILFKKALPALFATGELAAFAFSPDENKLVFGSAAGQIFLRKDGQSTLLGQTSLPNGTALNFAWSANGDLLLVSEKNQNESSYSVIDLADPQDSINLAKITPRNFSSLSWHPHHNYLLYGLSSNNLYKINLLTKTVKKIAAPTDDFVFANGELYLLRRGLADQRGGVILAKYNPLSLGGSDTVIQALPNHAYAFGEAFKNYLLIKDLTERNILLKNLDKKKEPLLKLAGANALWNQTNYTNYLFYHSGSEISALDLANQQTSLIGRYSNDLIAALPVNGAPYAILNVNNTLYLAELDDRDRRNIETLFTGKNVRNLWLDKKGKNLYFLDEIGAEKGIFKLELR